MPNRCKLDFCEICDRLQPKHYLEVPLSMCLSFLQLLRLGFTDLMTIIEY